MVIEPEFTEDQYAFYEQYHTQFDTADPNDENKLEYTPIYEKYVEIMEKIMEAKLKGQYGYTDEDIETFYKEFKADAKEFSKENADTVDILYGMVDFNKFKQSMLNYVKGGIDTKETDQESNQQN